MVLVKYCIHVYKNNYSCLSLRYWYNVTFICAIIFVLSLRYLHNILGLSLRYLYIIPLIYAVKVCNILEDWNNIQCVCEVRSTLSWDIRTIFIFVYKTNSILYLRHVYNIQFLYMTKQQEGDQILLLDKTENAYEPDKYIRNQTT